MSYFERLGPDRFRATPNVGGAWSTDEQHIAPALGLLAHVVELDRDRRREGDLVVARLSYDILGTVPVDVVDTAVTLLRPGRTIELVEASLAYNGRDVVRMRAWLIATRDTSAVAGGHLPSIPGPQDMPAWDPKQVWPGGFVENVEVRRIEKEPGRAAFWVHTPLPLVGGEDVSPLAATVGLLDIANGMTVRADPRSVAFLNVDLTAHIFHLPRGGWVGFDTTVEFGPAGLGVTHSVIHDVDGPIGISSQILTVRPG